MKSSASHLAIGLTILSGSLIGVSVHAQDWLPQQQPPSRQTSRLGGPITPTQNPFVRPYTNRVPASRPPGLTSGTERPTVIIRRDRNSTVLLEPLSDQPGPAPFLQEQNTGVQVIQVGR